MEILFEKIGTVAKITLNRPEKFNSVTKELAFKFQDYLDTCARDEEIRAVYLTGNGRAFSAGQDLVEITDPERNRGFEKILGEHYNPIILKIRNLKKPVVAAVNGVAAGASANIALACDVVVATESASFIQAFSKIGLIPDSAGTYFLPRLVGYQKALALAMLGDKVSAKEAEAMGMIYKVFPDEEFGEASWKLAVKLAAMPTKGLGFIKEAFNASLDNSLEEQLALEIKLQTQSGATEDYFEGVSSFVEKRKPNFTGK